MSNTEIDINLAITDGTFVGLMEAAGTYSIERQALYDRWRMLYTQYKELEFRVLLKICQV
jgi:hypothetical protein